MSGKRHDNPDGVDYGEPAYVAWHRHAHWAVGNETAPKGLQAAEKKWPILKDAREALWPIEYKVLVGTIDQTYEKAVRIPKPPKKG